MTIVHDRPWRKRQRIPYGKGVDAAPPQVGAGSLSFCWFGSTGLHDVAPTRPRAWALLYTLYNLIVRPCNLRRTVLHSLLGRQACTTSWKAHVLGDTLHGHLFVSSTYIIPLHGTDRNIFRHLLPPVVASRPLCTLTLRRRFGRFRCC
jgi:hypothetical protein